MINIQGISDSYLCSNCGACVAICPKESIEFKKSSMGRHFAHVKNTCISCGLCSKVCPSLNIVDTEVDPYVGHVSAVYVGRCTDDKLFHNGQSGGMATAILNYLFEESSIDAAVVTFMSEGPVPKVYGKIIFSPEELIGSQKSCYTPVELLSVLKESSHFKSVVLVGLPCHIEGIKLLQRVNKSFANVKYLIGLICDRTLCEGISDFIASFCSEPSLKIDWRRKNFSFRGKYYPYSSAPVVAYNSRGYTKVFPKYYRTSLKDLFTSPRCRVCKDKLNIYADVVLGDPWGMSGVDKINGMSLVLSRTDKGETIIQDMIEKGKAKLSKRSIVEVVKGQHISEREENVTAFQTALTYLTSDSEKAKCESSLSFSNETTERAYYALKAFIENEKKDKKSIIDLGQKILMRHKFHNFYKGTYIGRIINKIKTLLSK